MLEITCPKLPTIQTTGVAFGVFPGPYPQETFSFVKAPNIDATDRNSLMVFFSLNLFSHLSPQNVSLEFNPHAECCGLQDKQCQTPYLQETQSEWFSFLTRRHTFIDYYQ